MFTWLNKQGVRSDAGFEVQFTGRFTLEYREGPRSVTLHIEDGWYGGKPATLVDPEAFSRWDDDAAGMKIPRDRQGVLFDNLKAALEFQGLIMVVERGVPPKQDDEV